VKLGSEVLKEFTPPSFSPLKTEKMQVAVADIEEARKKLSVEIGTSEAALLRWSAADPLDGNKDFVPAAGAKAPQPKSIEAVTAQELFLHGVDVEKDGHKEAAAEIYRQVLERDPGFVPALLKEAWRLYRAGDFQGAEGLIYRALTRDPLDPDANYAAGVIYRASQRWTLAEDALWASLHFAGPQERALAQLGEIAIHEKKYDEAVGLLRRAVNFNPGDAMAKTDLAVALRLAGRGEEAVQTINETIADFPLFPWALAEQQRISSAGGAAGTAGKARASWAASLTIGADTYLNVAAWYRSLGDLASSDAVLRTAIEELPAGSVSPVVYYYLASNARREGKESDAKRYAGEAAAAPYAKIFPYRLEDALVLDEACHENPADAHAPYFLGNFLFAVGRYDDASRMWLHALGAGFDYSVLSRNLGVYAWRVKKDLEGAAGFFEKAIELAPDDYRLYVSLDEIYAGLGDIAGREKLMANAPATVTERDTVRVRRALVYLQQKRYEQALELLANHHYKPWEGGQVVRRVYAAANLEEGRVSLAAGKPREAERAFRRAMEYPVNLGVGKPDKPHDEEALYWLGEALQAAGDAQGANEAWSQAVVSGTNAGGAARVFAALAMQRLGRADEAEGIFSELLDAASSKGADASHLYVAGLVERYRNRESQARELFQRAIDADPDYWPAQIELERAPVSD
jgi:tetratricopeptide (TPR) repeat protein